MADPKLLADLEQLGHLQRGFLADELKAMNPRNFSKVISNAQAVIAKADHDFDETSEGRARLASRLHQGVDSIDYAPVEGKPTDFLDGVVKYVRRLGSQASPDNHKSGGATQTARRISDDLTE